MAATDTNRSTRGAVRPKVVVKERAKIRKVKISHLAKEKAKENPQKVKEKERTLAKHGQKERVPLKGKVNGIQADAEFSRTWLPTDWSLGDLVSSEAGLGGGQGEEGGAGKVAW